LNITRGKDVFQKIAKAGLPLVDVLTGHTGPIADLLPSA
jgi:hypothetical protein